jgi:peptidoglycan biosynthesis protein MviN/MurJ (putative lipid II flippase)
MEHDHKLYRARRRVEALTGFYIHAAIYVIVNVGLFLINLFTGPGWWVQWPIAGWGIGLIAHGIVVFGVNHPRVIAWEDEKVRELASRMP